MGAVSVSQGTPMAFGLWANAAVTLMAAAEGRKLNFVVFQRPENLQVRNWKAF